MLDTQKIDEARLEAFATRAIGDRTAGYTGVMVSLGSKLGLYKAMAGAGPLSAKEIATRADCSERYVAEWLNAQAAGGYIAYHGLSNTYELLPEQAMVLADEGSPVYIPHAWNVPASMWFDEAKALNAFRTGKGVAWGEHDRRLACGSAAFYRNGYRASLVPEWLPALEGVVAQLETGIAVADVGCGHGHSTQLMAEAFPNSRFHGFDTHPASLDEARQNAAAAGVSDRIDFALARADDYPDGQYGLICFFDILHDLGDPVAAARHAAKVLAPGGTVLLVEPFAHDHVKDNLSPVAQLYYSASTMICCAHAISEGGNMVLGAQAGQARLAEVFRKAGFTHFRRAAETPFNLIFEVRR
ncbi:methyltransferase domain-containing protein [Mesorhizobium sp. M9A.F.Ca.ET.002.03.1.2]|uniref:methyltransferase domain-containing protein n=1 Tax=Mesorhizobium sp. M9A.F.Ca.ET.002.03.1.2 TaxID=2493668 RepID=UPI000F75FEE4|nr:methyltransferase domain-containing protein [Mesorhizobium sp. M9A.F.Ca.ET.002.03.1.2]AZO01174.1 methyltransferase domain-containing protein [Mesorhizobium sp. M9A.F.Ca.ET.002.03.1.2]